MADFYEEVAGRVQRHAARPQPAGLLHAHAQPQRPPGVRPVQSARAAWRQVALLRVGLQVGSVYAPIQKGPTSWICQILMGMLRLVMCLLAGLLVPTAVVLSMLGAGPDCAGEVVDDLMRHELVSSCKGVRLCSWPMVWAVHLRNALLAVLQSQVQAVEQEVARHDHYRQRPVSARHLDHLGTLCTWPTQSTHGFHVSPYTAEHQLDMYCPHPQKRM